MTNSDTQALQDNLSCKLSITGLACYLPPAYSIEQFWQSLFPAQAVGDVEQASILYTHDEQLNANIEQIISNLCQEALIDDGEDIEQISVIVCQPTGQKKIEQKNIAQITGLNIKTFTSVVTPNPLLAFIRANEFFMQGQKAILLIMVDHNHSSFGAAAFILRPIDKTRQNNRFIYASLPLIFEGSADNNLSELADKYKLNGIISDSINLFSLASLLPPADSANHLQKLSLFMQSSNAGNEQQGEVKQLKRLKEWCSLKTTSLGDSLFIATVSFLLESILSIQQRILLPALNAKKGLQKDSNLADLKSTPFYRATSLRPWFLPQVHPQVAQLNKDEVYMTNLRHAAIHAVNENGQFVHLLLEECEDINESKRKDLNSQWTSELFIFVAANQNDLLLQIDSIQKFIVGHAQTKLLDLAFSVNDCAVKRLKQNNQKDTLPIRAAFVCQNVAELEEMLNQLIEICMHDSVISPKDESQAIHYTNSFVEHNELAEAKLAFVLPGLGAAYPNMLLELCCHFPEVRAIFDFVDYLATSSGSLSRPSERIFARPDPITGAMYETPASLAAMDSAVVTVLLAEWAIFTLLMNLGITPDALLGSSTGEFAALTMSGAIDIMKAAPIFYHLSTGLVKALPLERLINLRSLKVNTAFKNISQQLMQYNSQIHLSADLSSKQVILTGEKDAINQLAAFLEDRHIPADFLPFAVPYHTNLVSGIVSSDNADILALKITEPLIESWSCSLAKPYPQGAEQIRKMTTELFSKPILFRESIENLYKQGVRTFIEVGPRGSLTPIISETLTGRPHLSLAANLADNSALTQLNKILTALFINGVHIDLGYLYLRRNPSLLPIMSPPLISESVSAQREITSIKPPPNTILYLQELSRSFHSRLAQLEQKTLSFFAPAIRANFAFLSQCEMEEIDANNLRAKLFFSPTEHFFLQDHAIGGIVRENSERIYLVPLTVVMELMAEAANYLVPHLKVVEIRNLRAYKRLRVPCEGLVVSIEANRINEIVQVKVCSFMEEINSEQQVLMSAEVVLAPSYPSSSYNLPSLTSSKKQSRLNALGLYGQGKMFHGPTMQAVLSIDHLQKKEILGTIKTHKPNNWFADNKSSREFVLNPLLLDNATQLVLFYLFESNETADALLPFMLDSLKLYGNFQNLPEKLSVYVHFSALTERGTEADIFICDENDQIYFEFQSLSSRRIILHENWRQYIHKPENVYLTNNFLLPYINNEINKAQIVCRQFSIQDLPPDEGTLSWCADYVLSPAEMVIFHSFKQLRKRVEWLAGRIAIKEAVRILVKESTGRKLANADIEINSLVSGKPYVANFPNAPSISLTHKDGIAIAAAMNSSRYSAIGIDLEFLAAENSQSEDDLGQLVLNEDEQKKLKIFNATSAIDQDQALKIIWTAKEAVGKSLGLGLAECLTKLPLSNLEKSANGFLITLSNKIEDNGHKESQFKAEVLPIGNMLLAVSCN